MRAASPRPPVVGIAAGALVAVALVAAACSSSSSSSTSKAPAASVTSLPASAGNPVVKVASNPTYGSVLVNSTGMALYTYGADRGHDGQRMCTGGCLSAWPALNVPAGTAPAGGPGVTGKLAAVKQSDSTYQVTYNGLPLYTFAQDTSAGQVTGNNVSGFTVATVSAGSSGTGSSGAGSAPSTTAPSSGGYGGGGY